MSYDTVARIMQAIDLISQGQTPTAACKAHSLSVATFMRHVKQEPTLYELFVEATQVGHDTLADTLLSLDDMTSMFKASNEKELKIVSDNVKWYLSKKDNSRYGDSLVVTHNITADKAIVKALQAGQERALQRITEQKESDVEDVAFEVVDDDAIKQFR